jgi:hypothetical protein
MVVLVRFLLMQDTVWKPTRFEATSPLFAAPPGELQVRGAAWNSDVNVVWEWIDQNVDDHW